MEKIKMKIDIGYFISIILVIFLIGLCIGLVNGSSVILGNTSKQYLLCVYTPSGEEKGCSNNTINVTFSKNDFIFQLQYPQKDFFNNPLEVITWLPFLISILIVVVLLVLFVGGLTKITTKLW